MNGVWKEHGRNAERIVENKDGNRMDFKNEHRGGMEWMKIDTGRIWGERGGNMERILEACWMEYGWNADATWKRYERYFEWNMEELSVAYRWSMDEV